MTGQTGAVVHFLADVSLIGSAPFAPPRLAALARAAWPLLSIQIIDQPDAEA